MEPYTVALTSCGRFDLLEQTLASLLPRLDGPLAEVLIAEDSGDKQVFDVVQQFIGKFSGIEVIINDPPLGQVKSIDKLYSRIDTEWIFHCEDDWEFFADGFIGKSFAILNEFDRYSMVSLRERGKFGDDQFFPDPISASGVEFFALNPSARPIWAGLSFNPGLRRMRDYKIVGPYADLAVIAMERHVSSCYQELGFSIVHLAEPAVRHIGAGRHIRNQAKPSDFGGKLAVSAQKRFAWLRRKLRAEADPVQKARQRLHSSRHSDRRKTPPK
ncbi:MAG: hypothetical protein OXH59_17300 [Rhodospirillaceae bacterium]|nr:hypothetical protein [Rhodospirillaceae bacterium]